MRAEREIGYFALDLQSSLLVDLHRLASTRQQFVPYRSHHAVARYDSHVYEESNTS